MESELIGSEYFKFRAFVFDVLHINACEAQTRVFRLSVRGPATESKYDKDVFVLKTSISSFKSDCTTYHL